MNETLDIYIFFFLLTTLIVTEVKSINVHFLILTCLLKMSVLSLACIFLFFFSLLFFRVLIWVIPPLPNIVFFQFSSVNMYDLCSKKKREKNLFFCFWPSALLFQVPSCTVNTGGVYFQCNQFQAIMLCNHSLYTIIAI